MTNSERYVPEIGLAYARLQVNEGKAARKGMARNDIRGVQAEEKEKNI
jgi:hypothetical protein